MRQPIRESRGFCEVPRREITRAPGAELIEAGLNEGAERFALALLWALCRAASNCRRVGLQPCEASMIVLTSDRKQIGIGQHGERAPMAWDEGRDAVRAQIASTTSNWRPDGIDAKRDCWWDRHGRASSARSGPRRSRQHPRRRRGSPSFVPRQQTAPIIEHRIRPLPKISSTRAT